jgi:hypothetical protein
MTVVHLIMPSRAVLQDELILIGIEAARNVHLACFPIRYLAGMNGESMGENGLFSAGPMINDHLEASSLSQVV